MRGTASRSAVAAYQGEKRLFEARQTALKGQISQLKERVGQLKQEIKGLTAQRDAKNQEVELMNEEYERLEGMRKKELVTVQRLLSTQRDLTRLEGERGVLVRRVTPGGPAAAAGEDLAGVARGHAGDAAQGDIEHRRHAAITLAAGEAVHA